jgi:hypothetical protein
LSGEPQNGLALSLAHPECAVFSTRTCSRQHRWNCSGPIGPSGGQPPRHEEEPKAGEGGSQQHARRADDCLTSSRRAHRFASRSRRWAGSRRGRSQNASSRRLASGEMPAPVWRCSPYLPGFSLDALGTISARRVEHGVRSRLGTGDVSNADNRVQTAKRSGVEFRHPLPSARRCRLRGGPSTFALVWTNGGTRLALNPHTIGHSRPV